MVGKHMKDDNWKSSRQSILVKYDKNGDGVYDTDEVNAMIDDYMTTIKNNTALIDSNEGQRKLLIFAAVMIIILSISNLGTAFLAANLAKEIRVSSDGTMTSADGSKTAIKTMSRTDSLTVSGTATSYTGANSENRWLDATDGVFACFTADEVLQMYNNAKEGSGTTLVIQDEDELGLEMTQFVGGQTLRRSVDDSFERRLKEDGEADYVKGFKYEFPESDVSFQYSPDGCAKRRRRKLQFGSPFNSVARGNLVFMAQKCTSNNCWGMFNDN